MRIATVAALCLTAFAGSVQALDFVDCDIAGSQSGSRLSAECARFSVPENPDTGDAAANRVELFVTRVKSLAPRPSPDAVTLINGGPGASSVTLLADLFGVFQPMLRERDIIVVDQRGTGRSGALDCPDLESATQTFSAASVRRATRQCLEGLPADPRYYTTSVAVRDLEHLRQALGYDQLNLYGVSYGTRVALHYLRQYPQHTRSLIIDGVVPPDLALGPDIAPNAQARLDRLFARCSADSVCSEAFPDLQRDFLTLGERLRSAPPELNFRHPVTGLPTVMTLDYGHLAVAIRLLSYAPETSALIPLLIAQAARERNYLPIATQARQVIDGITGALSYGMHNAVVCTEDAPFYTSEALQDPAIDSSYLGREQIASLRAICEVWPVGLRDPDFKQPVRSDVPVLVLSGELDPITPPDYGDQVLPGLPNSRHLVAPGQGHGVIARGCVPDLARQFVERPEPGELDADCLERLRPDAFFINLMGPAP